MLYLYSSVEALFRFVSVIAGYVHRCTADFRQMSYQYHENIVNIISIDSVAVVQQ